MNDDRFVYMRAFPANIEQRGPRQLTGRLVPYNVVAHVLDEHPDGKRDIYREGFRSGAFDGQVKLGPRNKGIITKIGLIHRHDGGLGYLGPVVALREAVDGLWGDVNVLPSKAEDVGSLLSDGVDELSIEFRLRGGDNTEVDADGVRWRTRAHLDQVALEPKGAYSTAQVLAYRSEVEDEEREQAEADEEQRRRSEADEKQSAEQTEEQQLLEAEASAAMERRARWEVLTGRIDDDLVKQQRLVKDYGATVPGGYRRA